MDRASSHQKRYRPIGGRPALDGGYDLMNRRDHELRLLGLHIMAAPLGDDQPSLGRPTRARRYRTPRRE
jgi:hypothetical protein